MACYLQVASFRKTVEKKVGDKHEETMARMGAIMALGLVDAGGPSRPSLCRSSVCTSAAVVGLGPLSLVLLTLQCPYCVHRKRHIVHNFAEDGLLPCAGGRSVPLALLTSAVAAGPPAVP